MGTVLVTYMEIMGILVNKNIIVYIIVFVLK